MAKDAKDVKKIMEGYMWMFGEQREAGNGVIKINLKNKQKPKSQSEANKSQLLKKKE